MRNIQGSSDRGLARILPQDQGAAPVSGAHPGREAPAAVPGESPAGPGRGTPARLDAGALGARRGAPDVDVAQIRGERRVRLQGPDEAPLAPSVGRSASPGSRVRDAAASPPEGAKCAQDARGALGARLWAQGHTDRSIGDGGARDALVVHGIAIAKNRAPDRDLAAIPAAARARLVLTPGTLKNLSRVVAAWRRARPVLLEGPTSAGKTSLVRYLASVTGTPYRRINLSDSTTVYDLIGRNVKGGRRHEAASLASRTLDELRVLAGEYPGISRVDELDAAELRAQILEHQEDPRWVDGPVIQAMKRGEVLLLDEMNLAANDVLERLNSLFDDNRCIRVDENAGEVVTPHDNFRIFATMNPASYAGREQLTDAMRSRWNNIFVRALDAADLTQIVEDRYAGAFSAEVRGKLIDAHLALSQLAERGQIGKKEGGVAFTLRNLFRTGDRLLRLRGGALEDAALLRREMEEVYLGGLVDAKDRAAAERALERVLPRAGKRFYYELEVVETPERFTIGDVTIEKTPGAEALVPGSEARLILTRRTREILYRLAKAAVMGENVALVGERASGKTAIVKMLAALTGRRYYRQTFSADTDVAQLVGAWDVAGWMDGTILQAGRPGGRKAIYLADELNLASPSVLERLNPVLDDERALVLAEKDGERVELDPEFRFIASMNPPRKEYGGRKILSPAMRNRFTEIAVPALEDEAEQREILDGVAQTLGLGGRAAERAALVEALTTLHHRVASMRMSAAQLRERPVFSMRQLIEALRTVKAFEPERGLANAFALAAESYYVVPFREKSDRAAASESVKRACDQLASALAGGNR